MPLFGFLPYGRNPNNGKGGGWRRMRGGVEGGGGGLLRCDGLCVLSLSECVPPPPAMLNCHKAPAPYMAFWETSLYRSGDATKSLVLHHLTKTK